MRSHSDFDLYHVDAQLSDDERMVRYFESTTPLRRLAEPGDIAGVLAFLVGPDSSWLSGQVLTADGGLSVTGGF